MALSSEAKKRLAETIRGSARAPSEGLRALLIGAIHDHADRRYRLSVPIEIAGLDAANHARRSSLEAWLDERAASQPGGAPRSLGKQQLLAQAEQQVAATFLNRLVLLRRLEALGLSKPAVLTGGWNSKGYREFRGFSPALVEDDSEGFGLLLGFVFDELASTMPGLFGRQGLAELLPVPVSTLREVVERLDDPALSSAWGDDTTLGWVYQYWNDPERHQIDAELHAQRKLAAEDVAAKTQVFTDRYMVEWLLQNSLGFSWLCLCEKQGWVGEADALARAWPYYIPRPIPREAALRAPRSVRALKILDPACGSGHFLLIAFDLLAEMYRREARRYGETLSERAIAESILEHNLHGIDLDPRAVQLAAAGLYLKARALASDARPKHIHVVASQLELGAWVATEPRVVRLRQDLKREAGIPAASTDRLLRTLSAADCLGSLLKVELAVEDALRGADSALVRAPRPGSASDPAAARQVAPSPEQLRAIVMSCLERCLTAHSAADDLGLSLDGEQRGQALRFLALTVPGSYHLVVGNPPYFGTQALAETEYIDRHYPLSKENLCTAMLDRALELARPDGQVAFVAIRHWLYVSQLSCFRSQVFQSCPPACVADLGLGGFESLPAVEVAMVIAQRGASECFVRDVREGDAADKAARLAAHAECYRTDPAQLARLPGSPFVYRWPRATIEEYLARPLLGDVAPVRVGMKTSDNLRFLRCPWELTTVEVRHALGGEEPRVWVPYVKGAAGKVWIEPLSNLLYWRDGGLEVRLSLDAAYGQGPQGEKHFFQRGVAFSTIGREFVARAHRYPSICDVAGSSVFPADLAGTVCLLNSRFSREVAQDLNPTINFQVGDVARIPYRVDPRAGAVFRALEAAFAGHEATDELCPNFRAPGPSPWLHAQEWARVVIDSPQAEPLALAEPRVEEASLSTRLSFAVGVALGRFGAAGEGWSDGSSTGALPGGVLFLSASGSADGLQHAACALLRATWDERAKADGGASDLHRYLRKSFFDEHRKLYQNRPIYWPLSSAKKSFVAFIAMHLWQADTLSLVLAEHLLPTQLRLEGELTDLERAREIRAADSGRLEKRLAEVQKLLQELREFIAQVSEVAEHGPPREGRQMEPREVNARFVLELHDGVLVNSAALWPLLEPQWKDPKRWWAQLSNQRGPKGSHFDWSKTAARYFPSRVRQGCRRSAVLAVAHGCLWLYHPSTAYEWELRLRHDFRADFAIDEPDAAACRSRFLAQHANAVGELDQAEVKRQKRRSKASAPGHAARGRDA